MNIDEAIILALNEPRNYTNLRREARRIRKDHKESLSNEGFEEAMKRLRKDKVVVKKKISGRELEYSLNQNQSNLVDYVMKLSKGFEEKIEFIERFTKFIERKANEIDEGRKTMIEMGLSEVVKKDKIHHFVIKEYQTTIMELIRFTISLQKTNFFFTSKVWDLEFTKKQQSQITSKYSSLLDRLIMASKKLDKGSSISITSIIRRELSQELTNNNVDLRRLEKLIKQGAEITYYESLS
jgi:hypothetical protein